VPDGIASATINRRCWLLNNENAAKGLSPLPSTFHWCPQDAIDNTMLGCCDQDKFLVDNTLRKWSGDVSLDEIQAKKAGQTKWGVWDPSNTTWDALVDKCVELHICACATRTNSRHQMDSRST